MASTRSSAANIERTALVSQGVLAILFGIAAVFWPGLTAEVLIYLFGAFLLIDGVLAIVLGLAHVKNLAKASLVLFLGLLELGIGLYLIFNPKIVFATLILILGLVLMVRGAFALAHAFAGTDAPNVKAMHAILGALGVVIGIFVLAQPVAGGLAFVWVLGLYALVAGPVLIAMSAHLAKARH